MIAVSVDIFEGDDEDPVLTHVAYGATEEEAWEIIEVHRKYDEFLDAALDNRPFRGMKLSVETEAEEVPDDDVPDHADHP